MIGKHPSEQTVMIGMSEWVAEGTVAHPRDGEPGTLVRNVATGCHALHTARGTLRSIDPTQIMRWRDDFFGWLTASCVCKHVPCICRG